MGWQPDVYLDDGSATGRGSSSGFGLSNSYSPSLGSTTGGSSGGFGLSYSYGPTSYSPAVPSGNDLPLWQQLLVGLGQVASVLDPYIFTEQERAQAELQRLQYLAEMEKARQASIETQPRVPTWAWLVVGGAVVVVLVLLLKE